MERIFLGWDRPALASAVDFLASRHVRDSQWMLENIVVVVPGSRAGRRLIELLVERSAERGWTLIPPTVVTPAALAGILAPTPGREAKDLERLLLWRDALLSVAPAGLANVFPTMPARDDLLGWISLAELIDRLHRELGGEDLDFQDVVTVGARLPEFTEQTRWQSLAKVQEAYRAAVAREKLVDATDWLRNAAKQGARAFDRELLLLAVADLAPGVVRANLLPSGARVTALVHAPSELADRFDEIGCIRTSPWKESRLDIPDGYLAFEDDAKAQAKQAVAFVQKEMETRAVEEITLGMPDESLIPVFENHFEQAEIAVRSARGTPIARTSPFRMLNAVADFLDQRLFSGLADLVRHPEFLDAIRRGLATFPDSTSVDWLTFLDKYHRDHLQAKLPHDAFQADGSAAWVGSPTERPRLARLCTSVGTLLKELLDARQRPLRDWAQTILALLLEVHGEHPVEVRSHDGHLLVETLSRFHDELVELYGIPDTLSPRVTATEAIRLVLRQLERVHVPSERSASAVEMLGWLELQMDDAPLLFVAGMNDGRVPSSINADLFLPNNLRQQLGLLDNDRRLARDAFGLSAILASRPLVRLIAGRRSVDGDPLNPSRLLLAAGDETLVARISAFYETKRNERRPRPGEPAIESTGSPFVVPPPRPLERPLEQLSVTAFRDYLACPYRFYLRHVLGLESLDDSLEELDGGAFGNLAHDVLRDFGKGPAATETNGARVREFLRERLEQLASDRYGSRPMPAVRIQVAQLGLRLDAFAHWQANWSRDGWRIREVERSFGKQGTPFDVDGIPFLLRGRIDRIDVHESSGRIAVFDYKTADAGRDPDATHRKKGEWIDLQLPLYRHLLGTTETRIELGYIVLPKDMAKSRALLAPWTEAELEEADETARDVVRGVRAERFWPRTQPAPKYSEEFAAICQDDQLIAAMNEELEQEGA